jgi:hypothetical protein
MNGARYLEELSNSHNIRALDPKGIASVALSINVAKTLLLMLRLKSHIPRILIFPRVHCRIHRSALIDGTGHLLLGKRWDGSGYKPSEFKLKPGSVLTLDGVFVLHTGCSISVDPGAHLRLGSGYANNNITIDCFDRILIGEGVAISKGVTIRDSDGHSINGKVRIAAPITVGNHVWIGLNATILKGVSIGNGAVVAAGAVVTRDVPARTLVAGVPARVIKSGITWE